MGWRGAFCQGSGEPCVLAKFTRCLKGSTLPLPHNHPDMFYKFAHLIVCCAFFGLHCFFTVFQNGEAQKNNIPTKNNPHMFIFQNEHIMTEQ